MRWVLKEPKIRNKAARSVRWDLQLPIALIFLEGRRLACPNLLTYTAISFLMSTMCVRAAESDGARRREGEERVGATCYTTQWGCGRKLVALVG